MYAHIFSLDITVFKLSSLNFSLSSSEAISWEQAGEPSQLSPPSSQSGKAFMF